MSILIMGMEMPKKIEPGLVIEFADGIDGTRYARLHHYRYGGLTDWLKVVSVPPHGRLIDADALMERIDAEWNGRTAFRAATIVEYINDAPTIIPEDEPAKDTNVPTYDLLYEEGGYNSNGV